MPRRYKVPATMTVTAAGGNTDIFQMSSTADDKPFRVVGFRLGNSTEVGDAGEEGIELQLLHMTGTVTDGGGTGSTTVTPVPVPRPAGTAAGFQARVNSPTVATTTGTTTVLEYISWLNRNTPLELWYPDTGWGHEGIQSEALILRMSTTLADDMTMTVTVFVEEEG